VLGVNINVLMTVEYPPTRILRVVEAAGAAVLEEVEGVVTGVVEVAAIVELEDKRH